ncbi:MAG: CoA transferase [Candidatus Competibacteraceae bacterium]|nr:CoA transferase [Candidatus Competibacteraceae bacterium]MBK8962240.1 CoA transferase [Candidatus Competibacteraceae bacterium]MBK9951455.1 CoA transferase [Candidatus Competibacteraceae bacterium]
MSDETIETAAAPDASDPPQPSPHPASDAEPKLPMSGIRVLDLGTFLAGPHAASVLGEFGAEVLKIEHPIAGDPMRRFGTPTKRHDATLAWLSEARNRKSVTIDLRQQEGVQLFLRLIEKSDVLIENFRPGTMEEWGLGWPRLQEANPRLVYLQVSGYGQTGPYRRRSGFAHIAHAYGGLSYLAGFPGETPVVPGTVPLGDYFSSLYGAIGIMMALRHREKTGRGQVIDIAIYESVFRQLDEIAASYGLFGKVREREGSGSFVAVPHGHFRTQDDKWVAIACTTDKMFERLAEAMERPELASSALYGQQRKRLAARGEVNQIVTEWVGSLPRSEVLERCLNCEVPVGKLNSIADIFEDEHFQARGNLVKLEEPGLGEVVIPGVVPRMSATPGRITNLGPSLGDGTYEIMRELLGLSPDEIKHLRQRKII